MPFPFSNIQNNITDGLIGWWRFNESTGISLSGSSGIYARNYVESQGTGTYMQFGNLPVYVHNSGALPQSSLTFNGFNQTGTSQINLSYPALSFSFWLNSQGTFLSAVKYSASLLSIGGTNSFEVGYTSNVANRFGIQMVGDGGTFESFFTPPNPHSWHHYVIILNRPLTSNSSSSSGVNVYVDSVPQSITIPQHVSLGVSNFSSSGLVFNPSINSGISGAMQDLRIYNRTLAYPQEILSLYQWK